jgi:hypothetical protein
MKISSLRLPVGVCTAVIAGLIAPLAISCATHHVASNPPPSGKDAAVAPVPAAGAGETESEGEAEATPAALSAKLARNARFAPDVPSQILDNPQSFAEQDWLEHSVDGADNSTPSSSAFATARRHWSGYFGRGDHGTGRWEPFGPTNGQNDLTNEFRDRTVYTSGTENFGGRTVHAVISPDCRPGRDNCTLWIAASNGGVWRTDNALAVDNPATRRYEGPEWEFVSPEFAQQNTSALELDPNDHRTLWAGTGEPNACSSGCEVGVGLYKSKNGGRGWRGPFGSAEFSARAVGSIEVKPGDSRTIFVASGRATRGISNTCCGGADALIPGAPHFGLWRSTDEGQTWTLVNQGAAALCTANTPDEVSLNQTPCSARGARRVKIDPVDPNTVYASFFARGIWRSRSNGDPGTWEQIMLPRGVVTLGGPTTERDEFDVVVLPSGETRMYVGAGGGNYTGTGTAAARLRRNDAVRATAAATVQAAWLDFPTYSFAYCEPQCSYDNYVYAPANPDNAPLSGAGPDVVYLSGANSYNENNTGTGRSNGRAVLLSTDAGVTFTDMTEDDRSSTQPGTLHPDHHAVVVNPLDWKQFFDFSDGGVNRSNGQFVDDTADCTAPPHSFTIPSRIAFCNVVLSRVPQTLNAINRGLRTLAAYTMDYDRNDPERLAAGTQDNGSWETVDDRNNWTQINIADGGPNRYDATGHDSRFALTSFQSGQLMVRYDSLQQVDANWIADTIGDPSSVPPYALEASAFMVPAVTDPVAAGWMYTGREHVFRSKNYGRNPFFGTGDTQAAKDAHRADCNIWYGAFGDLNGNGVYDLPGDRCDDWEALGDPSPSGRLTAPEYGADRQGLYVSADERAVSDSATLWAATGTGRIFISKNANAALGSDVVFTRLDSLDPAAPPRYPTSIFVDRHNPNHAWITYSGYNAKTPATPGHIFEVTFTPGGTPAATFVNRDGTGPFAYGDIPANSVVVSRRGTLLVANDYGVVASHGHSGMWRTAAPGLPNLDVPHLIYAPERQAVYAATHGQGVWRLRLDPGDDDGRHDDDDDHDGHGGHGGH